MGHHTDGNGAPRGTIGVVGTGVMGGGIAQLLAGAGWRVRLFDKDHARAEKAAGAARDQWAKLVTKGKMTEAQAAEAGTRLVPTSRLADLADCGTVVEAIVEDLAVKRSLMADLEAVVSPECLLATNTSSLSVTAIQAGLKRPERVLGWHFFNPVPLMKVAEVIPGELTAESAVAALTAVTTATGHRAVRATDTPGFIVNHAGRGYGTEALRAHAEGVADFATIDKALRDGAGFRMGPFELLDLTGLDVSHPVMESIYEQYYQEPRFRPVPLTKRRMVAGLLGRKTGRGFYAYANGVMANGKAAPHAEAGAAEPWRRPIRVVAEDVEYGARVATLLSTLGFPPPLRDANRDDEDALILVAPLGEDITHFATARGLDARRCIGVDVFAEASTAVTLMASPAVDTSLLAAFAAAIQAGGGQALVLNDSPGFLCQRVLAHVVNVACEMAQLRVGTPADIDDAVRLGLGYPRGPLAWGDELGAARLVKILENVQRITGDPRYRPSLWLKRRALLGLSLLAPDAISPMTKG